MSSMDSALVRQCLHWAMPVGALLAALPSGHLCARLGARQFLFWAALLSSTAALFVRIGIGAIQILCATLFLQVSTYACLCYNICIVFEITIGIEEVDPANFPFPLPGSSLRRRNGLNRPSLRAMGAVGRIWLVPVGCLRRLPNRLPLAGKAYWSKLAQSKLKNT
jgi:hypothetical protein